MPNPTNPMIKEIAQKICDLTGYGTALHPNDIKPELVSLYNKGVEDALGALPKEENNEIAPNNGDFYGQFGRNANVDGFSRAHVQVRLSIQKLIIK